MSTLVHCTCIYVVHIFMHEIMIVLLWDQTGSEWYVHRIPTPAVALGLPHGRFWSTLRSSILESIQLLFSASCFLHAVFVFQLALFMFGTWKTKIWVVGVGQNVLALGVSRRKLRRTGRCWQGVSCTSKSHPSHTTSSLGDHLDRKHNNWKNRRSARRKVKTILYLFRLVFH